MDPWTGGGSLTLLLLDGSLILLEGGDGVTLLMLTAGDRMDREGVGLVILRWGCQGC